jgi:hypothetical protein
MDIPVRLGRDGQKSILRSEQLMKTALCTLAALLTSTLSVAAADLRAGAAAVKITPVLGTPMAGYYSPRGADAIHDDLYAKAIVLEKDGVKAALVSLDLITTQRGWVNAARREIENRTGIPGVHVMISATHTHTGPELAGRGSRQDILSGDSALSRRYTEELPGKIAEAVRLAERALSPVHLWAARGHEDSIAFNRRYFMKDGTVGWNPGLLNPNIVKPAGPIDPEVPVLWFETPAKKAVATYVNYAVHLDNVGGTQISADLPYTLRKLLGEVKGPDLVSVYTTGTCGDINHINVNWGVPQRGHENAARMGVILAGAVLRTLPQLRPVEAGSLGVQSEILKLPLPRLEPGDLERAREVMKRRGDRKAAQPKFLETVFAYKALDVHAQSGKPSEVEVQVITLGNDLAWVGLPGEIFVELGLEIKKRSLFKHTIIAELANGSIGYVPTRRAYAQGNYEVVSARCAEGSGEMLVEAALRLLNQFTTESQSSQRKGRDK